MIEQVWHLELFGGLRIRQGQRVLSRFRTQKTGGLLAYLAYYRGRSHAREVLTELFWPESEPDASRHSLSQALSSLRSQLEPPGVPAGTVVVADKHSVELNPDAFTTDVAEFELALRQATLARNVPDRASRLAEAVEKYGGTLLAGYYEDWIAPEQERLAGRFRQAATDLLAMLEREGDTGRAMEVARRAVEFDPVHEELQRGLIRALAGAGRPAEAVRQYREFERLLESELGQAPERATRELVRRIEADLAQTVPSTPTQPAARRALIKSRPPYAGLPSGTVTFLLTDIEGSTALWEREGDAFRSALSLHHALLRNEFRRNGGSEVKEAGDSFLVAFGSAMDALACAVAGQRALSGQEWPVPTKDGEAVVPRVRMALHTGDVELEEEQNYHGLSLHRASRMLQAAHGGQILCSEATAALTRRDLDPQVRLRDLGLFRLRDVEGAERLFQVDYANAPVRDFPPLLATPTKAAHLPVLFTRFFGREKELRELGRLLAEGDVRLITLTGAGGTGKTRLAIEAARRASESFAGSLWFVSLADLSDSAMMARAITDALGLPRLAQVDPRVQVVEALTGEPTLLILDNFEQVVESGAGVLRDLLTDVPALKAMVTSRQVLGLEGEREFVVPPLATPHGSDTPERLSAFESVRLFVDRAQAVKPDFRVTNSNAPAVAELCDRLEGIPLAIELAAARAQMMTPAHMLEQLEHRFDFLVSRKRGTVERQKTLRAAVDWSYRLLAPDLQRFFCRLSVFRGGWTSEAAESVCGEPLALDFLAQLRDASLVSPEESAATGEMRFRMMETLREYTAERLTAQELSELARRHAAHFLALAEEADPYLTGPEQAAWLAHLEAEHYNLLAALAWLARNEEHEMPLRLSGALWRFWSVRGHFAEGRRALEEALETSAGQAALDDSAARALALAGAGALAHDLGDFASAERWLKESSAIYGRRADRHGLATTVNLLANIALDQDQYERARGLYEEALGLWRELGDARGQAMVLSNLGALSEDQGGHDRAAELLTESVRLKRSQGNAYGLAISLDTLGNVERGRGKAEQAAALYEEALAIRRDLGHKQGVAMSLCNLGSALLEQGETEQARTHLLESLGLFEGIGDVRGSLECLSSLTGVLCALGRHAEAARLLGALGALRLVQNITPSTQETACEAIAREAAQTALGEKTFESAAARGKGLTLDEARNLART